MLRSFGIFYNQPTVSHSVVSLVSYKCQMKMRLIGHEMGMVSYIVYV